MISVCVVDCCRFVKHGLCFHFCMNKEFWVGDLQGWKFWSITKGLYWFLDFAPSSVRDKELMSAGRTLNQCNNTTVSRRNCKLSMLVNNWMPMKLRIAEFEPAYCSCKYTNTYSVFFLIKCMVLAPGTRPHGWRVISVLNLYLRLATHVNIYMKRTKYDHNTGCI